MKRLPIILRFLLALVFLYSGFLKVFNLQKFAGIVRNINILPDFTDSIIIMLVPILEILLAFLLILKLWVKPALRFTVVLLIVFIILIAVSVVNETYAGCGCLSFKKSINSSEGYLVILRDLLFILASLFILKQEKRSSRI